MEMPRDPKDAEIDDLRHMYRCPKRGKTKQLTVEASLCSSGL